MGATATLFFLFLQNKRVASKLLSSHENFLTQHTHPRWVLHFKAAREKVFAQSSG
jgi:hypothetical protein